jgi:hypothetical protein
MAQLGGAVAASAWTAEDVRGAFARWQREEPDRARLLAAETPSYVEYHSVRYARLLRTVDEVAHIASPADGLQILDVGPNIQTALLRDGHPGAVVDTLGFAHPAIPPRGHERHIEFDLNDVRYPERRPKVDGRYDMVVMAEVVEHLYTPLAMVLSCAAGWLRPGAFVILQTPNGAALHKRMRLLLGHNPVGPPGGERENPGHFHEYTLAELREQVTAAGLLVERVQVDNHFGGTDAAASAYRGLGRLLPATMRHGVTLCARARP